MKSILVTGCAGFIGSRFVELFQAQYPDYEIIGIDDLSTGKQERVHEKVRLILISITEKEYLRKVFQECKPECVFHFAAMPRVQYCQEHPQVTHDINVIGTKNVLECAAEVGVKKVIFSSSAAVYGNVATFPVVEATHVPDPISQYGIQKYEAEKICYEVCQNKSIDVVCLRYFNVYGPHQDGTSSYSTVISRWLDAMKEDKSIVIEGDGTQSRDFVYIDDIVSANFAAMNTKEVFKGEAFNIATNTEISLNEVREVIEKETGKKLTAEFRPSREGDIKHIRADISKAERFMNWKPQTDFDTGIKETIRWYVNK